MPTSGTATFDLDFSELAEEAWERAGGRADADSLVWCKITPTGAPTSTPLTVAAATELARRELQLGQLGGAKVDAHWARHTGRHLIQYELGFGEAAADLMGDWKPPSGGGQRRKSVGEAHYAHLTVDETWERAMEFAPVGFSTRCCKRQ
jgi:hypothetical protein